MAWCWRCYFTYLITKLSTARNRFRWMTTSSVYLRHFCFHFCFSLKFVHKYRINNTHVLGQILAWNQAGDTPLSERAYWRYMSRCVEPLFKRLLFLVRTWFIQSGSTTCGTFPCVLHTILHNPWEPQQKDMSVTRNRPLLYPCIGINSLKTKDYQFGNFCRHWWHSKLTLRQLTVPPMTTKLWNWRPLVFNITHHETASWHENSLCITGFLWRESASCWWFPSQRTNNT